MIIAQKTALVTGATGFVGSNLVQRLLQEKWHVHVILRPESSLGLLSEVGAEIGIHRHDGSTEGLVRIVRAAAPQVIYHVASLFLAQHGPSDVEPLIRSNLLFPAQLLEAANLNGVRHLINTGTSWQHYENREYDPVCLYAATKEAFEALLAYYTGALGLSAITLKLFDTYGPADPRAKLLTLLNKAARTQELLRMSGGEQLIDIVYIDDVVDAYLRAADRLLQNAVDHHETYAVTSGRPVALRDLVAEFCRISGQTLRIEWGARPYRSREVMVPWSAGALLPGWKPRVSFEEGVKRIELGSSSHATSSEGGSH